MKLLIAIALIVVAGVAIACYSHTGLSTNKDALRIAFLLGTMVAAAGAWIILRGVKPNKK